MKRNISHPVSLLRNMKTAFRFFPNFLFISFQSVDESIRKLMLNSHKSTDLHESMMSHWRYESEDTNGERHRLGNYQRVARHYMGYKMAIFFFFFIFLAWF
ncbi:hypothetical protein BDE02_13G039700 [Populus trichocarpa]|nr:hypothetical protein BDE02_13G039700 [Populus trichocarpa]